MKVKYTNQNDAVKYITDVLTVDVDESTSTVTVTNTNGTAITCTFTKPELFERAKKEVHQSVNSDVLLYLFESEDDYESWIANR